MTFYLWLDDVRPAPVGQIPYQNISWARSYKEAIRFVNNNIRVSCDTIVVDFDHDLGQGRSGYDFAKWLLENGICGYFRVHSMNPVGAKNIRELLTHYGWREI